MQCTGCVADTGIWSNVIIDGSRDEEDIKPAVNPDCGFIELANGHLHSFRISGYADGDESCPVIRGSGSLRSGTVVSSGHGIRLNGSMVDVDVRTSAKVDLVVNGDVLRSSYRGSSIGNISVSGQLELEDGTGGVLLSRSPLFQAGEQATWTFPDSELTGLYEASFAGDRLLLHSSRAGGVRRTSLVSHHDQRALSGNRGTGTVDLISNATVVASFQGTGGYFTVRRLAA